jgi:hypothetical protein
MINEFKFEGFVHKVKKVEKKAGGYFTTFSLSVPQGKDKDTGDWKPSGWVNAKVFGELGSNLELQDKDHVIISGYHVWSEGNAEGKYKGFEYHVTEVEVVGQSASQKKADDDSSLPF